MEQGKTGRRGYTAEEEAESLWAEEAQRRLQEYRAGRARAVPAEQVANKAGSLLR